MKVAEIVGLINGKLLAGGETEIRRVAGIETAAENEISFVEKIEIAAQLQNTKASCLIVPENFSTEFFGALIEVKNPKLAFARIAAILHAKKRKSGIHPTAQIGESAKLGEEIFVGAFAAIGENATIGNGTQIFEGVRVGDGVSIGENCLIHPNVVIYDNVSIGDDVILHSGAVLGADGFGFVRDETNGYVKFPQIGAVVIENTVEIGANTCIDGGSLGETRVGAGTKIDNLVQIAHNVQIGKRVVIAAQTGISGSTVIEDDCIIGGQVGMGDHARVLSGAIIGSQAGVLPGKIVRAGVWWGTPVQPLDQYKLQNAHLKGISRLKEEIKQLKKQIRGLPNETND